MILPPQIAVPLALARANWRMILGCGMLLAIMLLFTLYKGEQRHSEKLQFRLNELSAMREEDRRNYERAQADAAEANKAEVARIEAEQERINDKARSDYQRDLARLRAGGVRKDIATPQGSPGCPKASADGKAASGPDGEIVCVSRALILRAAEIELGRNALIDWINEQLKVAR